MNVQRKLKQIFTFGVCGIRTDGVYGVLLTPGVPRLDEVMDGSLEGGSDGVWEGRRWAENKDK